MEDWSHSSNILDLGTGWRCAVRFMPQPLYLRAKIPRYHLDRKLGAPRASLEATEKRYYIAVVGNRIPAVQPVAIPTEISRLSVPVIMLII
jgi:hypothetical protein